MEDARARRNGSGVVMDTRETVLPANSREFKTYYAAKFWREAQTRPSVWTIAARRSGFAVMPTDPAARAIDPEEMR